MAAGLADEYSRWSSTKIAGSNLERTFSVRPRRGEPQGSGEYSPRLHQKRKPPDFLGGFFMVMVEQMKYISFRILVKTVTRPWFFGVGRFLSRSLKPTVSIQRPLSLMTASSAYRHDNNIFY